MVFLLFLNFYYHEQDFIKEPEQDFIKEPELIKQLEFVKGPEPVVITKKTVRDTVTYNFYRPNIITENGNIVSPSPFPEFPTNQDISSSVLEFKPINISPAEYHSFFFSPELAESLAQKFAFFSRRTRRNSFTIASTKSTNRLKSTLSYLHYTSSCRNTNIPSK
jgi:hypothetical protein